MGYCVCGRALFLCLWGGVFGWMDPPGALAQPSEPAPTRPTELAVSRTTQEGVDVYSLTLIGDGEWTGPQGVFYRTRREIRNARVIEVAPPSGRAIPRGSNVRTQLALWNEVGEDGKLWPQRAIRHGGSDAQELPDGTRPLGNWGDDNRDGANDLGFVCIGPIDYRIMLRYGEFNPVPVSGMDAKGNPLEPEVEPWRVGEPPIPAGLSARDVPAYDVDGDGVVDPTGYMGGGCHLYIVQFWVEPTEECRLAIRSVAGTLYDYIADTTYIARLESPADAAALVAMPVVRHLSPLHPVFRADPAIIERLFNVDRPPTDEPPTRQYNLMTFDSGRDQKRALALDIESLGAVVNEMHAEGRRFSATLTKTQLGILLDRDELAWVDAWTAPEPADSNAKEVSGVNFLYTLFPVPFRGEGVCGEVMDNRINYDHEAFQGLIRHEGVPYPAMPLSVPCNLAPSHGTNAFGVVFGTPPLNCTGQPPLDCSGFRGILPNAEGKIWASWYRLYSGGSASCPNTVETSREKHIEELVLQQDAVFQSNSWGHGAGSIDYDSYSSELDDILFHWDLLVCQAQGNNGGTEFPRRSAPEAWCKNVVSIGGVIHHDDSINTNDEWCPPLGYATQILDASCGAMTVTNACASTGPASDGRIKPDLTHFFESVATSHFPSDAPLTTQYTCGFGGTSAATPITAGLFGLLFQMWHRGVFPGYGNGYSVFEDRPHMTTAKALMINGAYRYDMTTTDLTRMRQGWGRGDVKRLWEDSGLMTIINETDKLSVVGQEAVYSLSVSPSNPAIPLKATLVYADPAAVPMAAIHRVNDLNLIVVSPSGVLYRGNEGLDTGNWSPPAAPNGIGDSRNTVENVFIATPEAGTWTVRVQLRVLAADGDPESPCTPPCVAYDADFALVISAFTGAAATRPVDWNEDGAVDTQDVLSFLDAFKGGVADFDGDGDTSILDLYSFIDAFLGRSAISSAAIRVTKE